VPAEPPFSFTEHDDGTTLMLALRGELDLAAEQPLLHRLGELTRTHRGPLVLDLCAVTFMDSSGVRVLVLTDGHARRDGWQLTVRVAEGPVLDLLTLTGLTERLPIERPSSGPDAGRQDSPSSGC
jgi:anti-sigma B factor antagonist